MEYWSFCPRISFLRSLICRKLCYFSLDAGTHKIDSTCLFATFSDFILWIKTTSFWSLILFTHNCMIFGKCLCLRSRRLRVIPGHWNFEKIKSAMTRRVLGFMLGIHSINTHFYPFFLKLQVQKAGDSPGVCSARVRFPVLPALPLQAELKVPRA